jgi:hypothetical protein
MHRHTGGQIARRVDRQMAPHRHSRSTRRSTRARTYPMVVVAAIVGECSNSLSRMNAYRVIPSGVHA